MRFYVYILYRPDGRPFYVGKGSGNRWQCHLRPSDWCHKHNQYKARIIRNILNSGQKVDCRIIARFEDEDAAFSLEKCLIKQIGRRESGGPLTNLTDGGDGLAGLPPEIKAKQPRFKPGQTYTPERNAKISAAKKGRPHSPEHGAAISRGKKGRPLSETGLVGRRAANAKRRGSKQSEATQEKKRQKLSGRKRTPEQVARIRAGIAQGAPRRGVPKSPEHRARISAAATERWSRDRTPRAIKGPDGKFVAKD